MKRNKKLKLSQILDTQSLTKTSIIVRSKGITFIDTISSFIAREILTMDLSDNYIAELVEMRQFIKLQLLNITNNRISRGEQLINLYQCFKLKRVYLCGNSFLEQPLDEDVLEFILEKDTDIQILSGSALEQIRQIENGELKLIFLENYKKKINCHHELMQRNKNNNQYVPPMHSQSIIHKIIPQFYPNLQHSDIKYNIKKQTIQIKRDHLSTIEQAIQLKKQNQQQLVQNLIGDIVALVEQQDRQLLKNQHQHPQQTQLPSTLQSNKQKTHEQISVKKYKTIQYLTNKQDKFLNKKQIFKLSPQKSTSKKSKQLTIMEIKQLEQKQSQNDHIQDIISPVSYGSIRNFTTFQLSQGNDSFNYQTMYYRNLTKNNPIYTLLYSPISSLKNSQKQQLLQNLSKSHKEVTIDLYREKSICSQLRKQLKNLHQTHNSQTNKLIKSIKDNKSELEQKNYQHLMTKKQLQRLTQTLRNTFDKIKYLENIITQKQKNILGFQRELEKIESINKNFLQKIQNNQNQWLLEDIITSKRQKNIKSQYFKKIMQRGYLWSKYLRIQQQKKIKLQKNLKLIVWINLLNNKQLQKKIKNNLLKEKNQYLSESFKEWKTQIIINKKYKILNNYLLKQSFNFIFSKLNNKISTKNKQNFKNKLANNLFRTKYCQKIIKYLKIQRKLTKSKQERSFQYYLKLIKTKYFQQLKNKVKLTNEKFSLTKLMLQKHTKNIFIKNMSQVKKFHKIIKYKSNQVIQYRKSISWKNFLKKQRILQKDIQKKIKSIQKVIQKQNILRFYKIIILQKVQIIQQKNNIELINNLQIKNFYFYLKQNKSFQERKKQKKILLSKLIKQQNIKYFKQLFNNLRILLLEKKNKKRQLLIKDQYLRRQREWLNKMAIQDQKIQNLIIQLNFSNKMLTQYRDKQIILLKQAQQLQKQLQYKNQLAMATDAQLRGFKHDIINLEGKHTELLKNYCQTIDYINKKDEESRQWNISNTIDNQFFKQSTRRPSLSPDYNLIITSNYEEIRKLPIIYRDLDQNNRTKTLNSRKNRFTQSNMLLKK